MTSGVTFAARCPARPFTAIALALAAAITTLTAAAAPLNVVYINQTGRPDSEIFVQLLGSTAATSGGLTLDESTFANPVGYSLAQLAAGVELSRLTGRMYFTFGSTWTFLRAGYEPPPANPTDPNYHKRYDKIELNVTGATGDNMNTTAIDYFGIPIAVKTYDSNNVLRQELRSASGGAIISRLGSLASGNANVVRDGTGTFDRVIGPGQAPAGVYDSFSAYIDYAKTLGPAGILIQDHYTGNGGSGPTDLGQDYDFRATFDSAGNLTLTGSSSGIAGTHTITATHSALVAPTGIYGANAPYSVDGGAPTSGIVNDLYGRIVSDLLAGMNMGFIGSQTPHQGPAIGTQPSANWWEAGKTGLLFSDLQSNPAFYNQYAAALEPLTDAYGFAYTDYIGKTFASLDPQETSRLEIILLADGAVGAALPEPGSFALAAAALGLAFLGVRRRDRRAPDRRSH